MPNLVCDVIPKVSAMAYNVVSLHIWWFKSLICWSLALILAVYCLCVIDRSRIWVMELETGNGYILNDLYVTGHEYQTVHDWLLALHLLFCMGAIIELFNCMSRLLSMGLLTSGSEVALWRLYDSIWAFVGEDWYFWAECGVDTWFDAHIADFVSTWCFFIEDVGCDNISGFVL